MRRNAKTRSQAVARIADRTAKNCRGHVTYATPTFMVRLLCIPKFELSSSSSFWDMAL